MCSWRKSRAEMLGKQNYLPGPNVLTICCIVARGPGDSGSGTTPKCQQTLCGTPTVHAPLCGSLFNGNIAPFINTTIAGIIWCKSSPPTAY